MQTKIVNKVLKQLNRPVPFYTSNAELLELCSREWKVTGLHFSSVAIGRVMSKLGHKSHHTQDSRGWIINQLGETNE